MTEPTVVTEPTAVIENASIDDLLHHVEEPEPKPRHVPDRAVWWVKNVAVVGVFTLAVVGVLRFAGVSAPIVLILTAVVALRGLWLIVQEVAAPDPPAARVRRTVADTEGRYVFTGGDALRAAVRRWENRLQAPADGARFSRNVLPVLAELTDERLRQRHGITRASDPVRARQLLGEPLWRLLDEPGRRTPKAKEWAAHVATLEKL